MCSRWLLAYEYTESFAHPPPSVHYFKIVINLFYIHCLRHSQLLYNILFCPFAATCFMYMLKKRQYGVYHIWNMDDYLSSNLLIICSFSISSWRFTRASQQTPGPPSLLRFSHMHTHTHTLDIIIGLRVIHFFWAHNARAFLPQLLFLFFFIFYTLGANNANANANIHATVRTLHIRQISYCRVPWKRRTDFFPGNILYI